MDEWIDGKEELYNKERATWLLVPYVVRESKSYLARRALIGAFKNRTTTAPPVVSEAGNTNKQKHERPGKGMHSRARGNSVSRLAKKKQQRPQQTDRIVFSMEYREVLTQSASAWI